MALIAMAVFDTEENKRTEYTRRTLYSLFETVNFSKHRLFVIDNDSCKETKTLLKLFREGVRPNVTIITNKENIGTAEAINLAWKEREPGENCIKMDNDVVIHSSGWVGELEEVIRREPKIGQAGLKRKDLMESPTTDSPFYKSELLMLPHSPGETWIIVEKCNHIMGTCQMYSSSLLDKIGYLYQPKVYGFDDAMASVRSQLSGFINVFLPHINIDHIDTGQNPYTQWKRDHAAENWQTYLDTVKGYKNGSIPLYYNPFENGA